MKKLAISRIEVYNLTQRKSKVNYQELFTERMKQMEKWLSEESGQGMVEYALILALVVLVVISAISGVGTKVKTMWEEVENRIS